MANMGNPYSNSSSEQISFHQIIFKIDKVTYDVHKVEIMMYIDDINSLKKITHNIY